MVDWICDANIDDTTLAKLKEAGIKAFHVVRDYHVDDQKEDDDIIALAKREDKTLITADYRDFNSKNNVQYVNSPGVWIIKTSDPDKRVGLIKKTLVKGSFKTKASRKNQKVFIQSNGTVEITDVKTNKKRIIIIE